MERIFFHISPPLPINSHATHIWHKLWHSVLMHEPPKSEEAEEEVELIRMQVNNQRLQSIKARQRAAALC